MFNTIEELKAQYTQVQRELFHAREERQRWLDTQIAKRKELARIKRELKKILYDTKKIITRPLKDAK